MALRPPGMWLEARSLGATHGVLGRTPKSMLMGLLLEDVHSMGVPQQLAGMVLEAAACGLIGLLAYPWRYRDRAL